MARFMGVVRGNKGTASRLGSKASGLHVTAASWQGAVHVMLYTGDDGKDRYRIVQDQWHGAGEYRLLAEGVVGEAAPCFSAD